MADLLTALGLVLVLEGLLYAVAPDAARRMAEMASRSPADTLRVVGLVAVGLGTLVVWIVRS